MSAPHDQGNARDHAFLRSMQIAPADIPEPAVSAPAPAPSCEGCGKPLIHGHCPEVVAAAFRVIREITEAEFAAAMHRHDPSMCSKCGGRKAMKSGDVCLYCWVLR